MNKKLFLGMVTVAAMALSPAAEARGGAFGITAGANFSWLDYDLPNMEAPTRAGYTVGVSVEYIIPRINFGFEGSVLVSGRNYELTSQENYSGLLNTAPGVLRFNKIFMEVPIHLKWVADYVPGLQGKVAPYVFTGPALAMSISDSRRITDNTTYYGFTPGWDFGVGVRMYKHVQLGVCFRLGMTDATYTSAEYIAGVLTNYSRNRSWNATATWFF